MDTTYYNKQAIDFLKETNTNIDISFKEFNSMPWDKDKQKRNIFTVTLSNPNGKYSFDFGDSVSDSCGMEPKLNTLKENDTVSVYAGIKQVSGKTLRAGILMTLTKSDLLNTDYILLEKYIDELVYQFDSQVSASNKKIHDAFNDGKISKNDRDIRLIGAVPRGIAQQTILNAIKREIKSLSEEMVYSKDLQGDNMNIPTAYDVLSCITKYDPENFEWFCDSYGYDSDSRNAEMIYNSVVKEWKGVSMLWNSDELQKLAEIE